MAKRNEGYIYLIRDLRTGYVKIGYSKNPYSRLHQLSYQSTLLPEPHEFKILDAFRGSMDEEYRLHKLFAPLRIRGEWFDLCFFGFMDICYAFDSRDRLAGIEWERCDEAVSDPVSVIELRENCTCGEHSNGNV